MSDRLARARKYQDRAHELRSLAAALDNEETRRMMENLADEYEKMARSARAKITSAR